MHSPALLPFVKTSNLCQLHEFLTFASIQNKVILNSQKKDSYHRINSCFQWDRLYFYQSFGYYGAFHLCSLNFQINTKKNLWVFSLNCRTAAKKETAFWKALDRDKYAQSRLLMSLMQTYVKQSSSSAGQEEAP